MACLIMVGTGVVSVLGHNWSQLRGRKYRRPPWMGHQFSPSTAGGVISDAPPAPYRCRHEPLPGIAAGLVVVPSSVVYCGPDLPAEPTYTPLKRAPCRFRPAGPSASHRPDTRQLTERITLSDRDVLENAAPSRRSGAGGAGGH